MIFRFISAWLKEQERRSDSRKYDAGYGWAATEILRGQMSAEEVEAHVYNRDDPFDRGAAQAIRDLSRKDKL